MSLDELYKTTCSFFSVIDRNHDVSERRIKSYLTLYFDCLFNSKLVAGYYMYYFPA